MEFITSGTTDRTSEKRKKMKEIPPFPWFKPGWKIPKTPVIPKVPRYFISNGVTKDETLSDEEKFTTPPSTPKIRQPDMSFDNVFDPYQVFEVEHKPCLILTVKVICGRNITKGFWDYVDTPDPYISMKIRTAPEGRRRTKTIDNEVNPVWNEEFTFLLDENENNKMQINLMEANYGSFDQTIGTVWFDLGQLPRKKVVKKTFLFNEVYKSEVDMEFETHIDENPTLRYSLCLCDEEKEFLKQRKENVMDAMCQLMGDENGPQNIDEVPTIGVIGSGGGFRAMVGLSGVVKALADSGVLQCSTYLGGLSGSSWYISTLYSHQDWPNMKPGDMQDELMNNIDSSLVWLLTPQSIYRYLDRILKKRELGQPISFTDIFGHLVGETLVKDRLDFRLSDVGDKIKEGRVPLPLMTCVNVKADRSARNFQEWVEFSPYEIGMPKYGTFMKTEQFGSKFFLGKLCKQYEEPPLHFLQGIWGSAFCILFKRLLDDNRKLDPVEMIRQEMVKELEKNHEDESSDSSEDEDEEVEEEKKTNTLSVEKEKQQFSFDIGIDGSPKIQNGNGDSKNMNRRKTTVRRTKQKGYWMGFVTNLIEGKKFEVLNTRAGRAGVVHNFMRGLSLQQTFPLSPFTPLQESRDSDDFGAMFEMHPTNVKHLYMVDAGLTFNSPYPLLLRPQRGVDIILSFDFSARPSDSTPPFKELLLAEKWARLNKLPFPPIDITVFDREGMKELYIFKHPTDHYCPVVMHFVLVNIDFRQEKAPGVPRTTKEEFDFANFDIFDDPATPYSTFNFKYSHEAFKRLSQLTEFNTLANIDKIKSVIAEQIVKKRDLPPKMPIELKEVNKLRKVSVKNRQRLSKFLTRLESRRRIGSSCSELRKPDDSLPDPSSPSFKRSEKVRQRVTPIKTGRPDSGGPKLQRTSALGGLSSPIEADEIDAGETLDVQTRSKPGRKIASSRRVQQAGMSVKGDVWHDARCNSIDEDEDDKFYSVYSPPDES